MYSYLFVLNASYNYEAVSVKAVRCIQGRKIVCPQTFPLNHLSS